MLLASLLPTPNCKQETQVPGASMNQNQLHPDAVGNRLWLLAVGAEAEQASHD